MVVSFGVQMALKLTAPLCMRLGALNQPNHARMLSPPPKNQH